MARASYQPNALLTFTSRFRFAENDFTLQRTELETIANFGRWTTTVMYGNYAAQPLIGFLNRREGILGSARLKLNPNWVSAGGSGIRPSRQVRLPKPRSASDISTTASSWP